VRKLVRKQVCDAPWLSESIKAAASCGTPTGLPKNQKKTGFYTWHDIMRNSIIAASEADGMQKSLSSLEAGALRGYAVPCNLMGDGR
jgi:hypothetical protein